jgi:hypothetical protein
MWFLQDFAEFFKVWERPMPLSEGAAGTLWHANFKINAGRKGYQFKTHIAGVSEEAAITAAEDLAARMRALMPSNGEIVFATIALDNAVRDAGFLPGALGAGEYVEDEGPPVEPAFYDASFTALHIRMETPDRHSVQRIFNPIPDSVLTEGLLGGDVADVTALPSSVPAVGAGATWYEEFSNFMKALVKNTHYVKHGHAPGGVYQYSAWRKAFLVRVTKKKGGRSFV